MHGAFRCPGGGYRQKNLRINNNAQAFHGLWQCLHFPGACPSLHPLHPFILLSLFSHLHTLSCIHHFSTPISYGRVAEFLDWIANPPILLINYSTHRSYFSLIYGSFEITCQVVLLYLFISKLVSFIFEIRANQIQIEAAAVWPRTIY